MAFKMNPKAFHCTAMHVHEVSEFDFFFKYYYHKEGI